MGNAYVYEFVNGKSVRREATRINCTGCGKEILHRKDRKHSGKCRRCKVTGENNPCFGIEPHNKGLKTFNEKEFQKSYISNHRQENRRRAIHYLGNQCNICKLENLPLCCWDIHHIDPNKKEANVSQLFAYSWDKVKKEVDKCILLCALCHRVTHNGEERLNAIRN